MDYNNYFGKKVYYSQCSLELGNQRCFDICAFNNGEPRIDMREFKQTEKSKFTTKKSIIRNLEVFKGLALASDMVDTAMNKNEDRHYHIGGNIFLTVRSENLVLTQENTGNQKTN